MDVVADTFCLLIVCGGEYRRAGLTHISVWQPSTKPANSRAAYWPCVVSWICTASMTEIRSGLGWGRQEIRSLGTWQSAENWPRRAGSWHWQLISGSPVCPGTLLDALDLEARAVGASSHDVCVQPLTAPGLRKLSYSYLAPQISHYTNKRIPS